MLETIKCPPVDGNNLSSELIYLPCSHIGHLCQILETSVAYVS